MLPQLGNLLDKQSKDLVHCLGLLSALLLGVIDYLTGPMIAFSPFYLLPLAVIAWKVGRRAAIGASLPGRGHMGHGRYHRL